MCVRGDFFYQGWRGREHVTMYCACINIVYTYSSQCGTFCESGDVPLTSEQARVVTYPIQKGETIKVIAFAGT